MPTKGKYLHEMSLRIVLASLEAHANRYKRHIVPVLCVSIDFQAKLVQVLFIQKRILMTRILILTRVTVRLMSEI